MHIDIGHMVAQIDIRVKKIYTQIFSLILDFCIFFWLHVPIRSQGGSRGMGQMYSNLSEGLRAYVMSVVMDEEGYDLSQMPNRILGMWNVNRQCQTVPVGHHLADEERSVILDGRDLTMSPEAAVQAGEEELQAASSSSIEAVAVGALLTRGRPAEPEEKPKKQRKVRARKR